MSRGPWEAGGPGVRSEDGAHLEASGRHGYLLQVLRSESTSPKPVPGLPKTLRGAAPAPGQRLPANDVRPMQRPPSNLRFDLPWAPLARWARRDRTLGTSAPGLAPPPRPHRLCGVRRLREGGRLGPEPAGHPAGLRLGAALRARERVAHRPGRLLLGGARRRLAQGPGGRGDGRPGRRAAAPGAHRARPGRPRPQEPERDPLLVDRAPARRLGLPLGHREGFGPR